MTIPEGLRGEDVKYRSREYWADMKTRNKRVVWNSHCFWKFLLLPGTLFFELLSMLTWFDHVLIIELTKYKTPGQPIEVLHQLNRSDDRMGKRKNWNCLCYPHKLPHWFIYIFSFLNKVNTIDCACLKNKNINFKPTWRYLIFKKIFFHKRSSLLNDFIIHWKKTFHEV